MFIPHKKVRLFADSGTSSAALRRYAPLLKRAFLVAEPFLVFYGACGVLAFFAHFLVPTPAYRKAIHVSMAVLSLILTGILAWGRYKGSRQREEQQYIEHLVFLFCKHKSYRMALREMQTAFQGRDMKRTLNQAQYLIERGGDTSGAMGLIEKRITGRRVSLLHRYILETGRFKKYIPPAEILTGLITGGVSERQSLSQARFDRMRLAFCSVVSFGICFALRCFAQACGFESREVPPDLLMAAVFIVLAAIFFTFELKGAQVMPQGEMQDTKPLMCSWLRELIFFLLVRPVPEAIAISVSYADKRVKRRISKLASEMASGTVTAGNFLSLAQGCDDDKLKRILEFLYAKSAEPYLAPAELVPMLRMLDEIEAEELAGVRLESRRRRLNLLLAPQAASLIMIFGSVISLVSTIGGEL